MQTKTADEVATELRRLYHWDSASMKARLILIRVMLNDTEILD